jgi:hypothetical protein
MMIGVFIFRFNQASLTQYINKILNNEFSIVKRQEEVNDDIEQYFITHNKIAGNKFLEFSHLESWKYQCD